MFIQLFFCCWWVCVCEWISVRFFRSSISFISVVIVRIFRSLGNITYFYTAKILKVRASGVSSFQRSGMQDKVSSTYFSSRRFTQNTDTTDSDATKKNIYWIWMTTTNIKIKINIMTCLHISTPNIVHATNKVIDKLLHTCIIHVYIATSVTVGQAFWENPWKRRLLVKTNIFED